MANYRKIEKTKSIIIEGTLTEAEQQLVSILVGQGYKLKAKSCGRLTKEDIIKWFDKKKDKEGKEEFLSKNLLTAMKDLRAKDKFITYQIKLDLGMIDKKTYEKQVAAAKKAAEKKAAKESK